MLTAGEAVPAAAVRVALRQGEPMTAVVSVLVPGRAPVELEPIALPEGFVAATELPRCASNAALGWPDMASVGWPRWGARGGDTVGCGDAAYRLVVDQPSRVRVLRVDPQGVATAVWPEAGASDLVERELALGISPPADTPAGAELRMVAIVVPARSRLGCLASWVGGCGGPLAGVAIPPDAARLTWPLRKGEAGGPYCPRDRCVCPAETLAPPVPACAP